MVARIIGMAADGSTDYRDGRRWPRMDDRHLEWYYWRYYELRMKQSFLRLQVTRIIGMAADGHGGYLLREVSFCSCELKVLTKQS